VAWGENWSFPFNEGDQSGWSLIYERAVGKASLAWRQVKRRDLVGTWTDQDRGFLAEKLEFPALRIG